MENADQRVAIFIDGSNLYHSLEENCGRFDLDFAAFATKLCDGRSLYRIYYYNILQDQERKALAYQEQQKFLASLYSVPYLEVRLGGSKIRGDTVVEKGVDIMVATDMLQFAWDDLYDVAILVSGDGDFAYALQAVKNFGKHAEIAAFPSNLSWELAQAADDRHFLDRDYFRELWVGHRRDEGLRDVHRRRRRRRGPVPTTAPAATPSDVPPPPAEAGPPVSEGAG